MQNSWKWFIYTRTQNVNRNHDKPTPSDEKNPKRMKVSNTCKHSYPPIPDDANDTEANERNLHLLNEECKKAKPRHEVLKQLIARCTQTTYFKFRGCTGEGYCV